MKYFEKPSPNFNDRKDGHKPELIVLHYTGMKSTEAALERLSDPASGVSCHYLIDEKGNVYSMVPEDKRAWHAGVSHWQGKGDVNSRSIGIEISNRGTEPFTPEQIGVLVLLCHDLMHRHGIPPENVVAHSDIAPDRKKDPGPLFPWKKIARHDIGVWPEPRLRDRFNAKAAAKNEKYMTKLLSKAGYGIDAFGQGQPAFKELVAAFQSRFEPGVFIKQDQIGKPTAKTVAKLRALIRQQKQLKKKQGGP